MSRDKILVWGLSNNKGGTEAVIYNYASKIPEARFDFLCYEEPSNYSDLFRFNKNRFFVIPVKIKHPASYWLALRSFFRKHGNEYKTVWCNLNDISNIDVLVNSKKAGIPKRIAHFHSSSIPNRLITQTFSRLNKRTFLESATDYWACSQKGGEFAYGNTEFEIIPNAIDSNLFSFNEQKRKVLRRNLPFAGSYVIGTVGRLSPEKNHLLLVELLPQIIKRKPNAVLAIVGQGPLKDEIAQKAHDLGVSDHIMLYGSQSDIQGYLSMFDHFVLPSFYEGLSLSLLEAQFNGLPCTISNGVGLEGIISGGVFTVPLKCREDWVAAITDDRKRNDELCPNAAQFDIRYALPAFKSRIL